MKIAVLSVIDSMQKNNNYFCHISIAEWVLIIESDNHLPLLVLDYEI